MEVAIGSLPTYKQIYLQMLAYRSARNLINSCLSSYRLNSTQWIILGMVGEAPGGLRVTDLATRLQVEGAFITNTVRGLTRAGYIQLTAHPTDNRARLLRLSEPGKQLVNDVEANLVSKMQKLVENISLDEVRGYFDVLQSFANNKQIQE